MEEYCLITFVNSCTENNPCWEVYAHKLHSPGNAHLKTFKKKEAAIKYCFRIQLPVMQGWSNSGHISKVLLKLRGCSVSNQRELLIAYENKVGHSSKLDAEIFVDKYLADEGNL